MLKKKFHYLIQLQYLGFRYHGWQKQPNVKTVQYMVDRTLCFILGHENFKTLGSSRTDAMVSANQHLSELFIIEQQNEDELLTLLNKNLPADIRAIAVSAVDEKFQIIGSVKRKEYHYYFSYGQKPHPYSAPFMVNFQDDLDITLMQECAKYFEGTHNLKLYCHRPNENKTFIRKIEKCEIVKNDVLTASFFPENSYMLRVIGEGFLHHQLRLMMGTLIRVGTSVLTKQELLDSFKGEGDYPIGFIAPASGLHLFNNELEN